MGGGATVVLVHAWGLNSHMWNAQLPALLAAGLQVVTIDHRGHGRSDRPTTGYDLDTMAGDVLTVLDALDLHDVTLVGQSMGGTIVAHAVGGLGTSASAGSILSAPITPCLTAGPDNDLGLPAEAFESVRAAMAADIGAWITANSPGVLGRRRGPLAARDRLDHAHDPRHAAPDPARHQRRDHGRRPAQGDRLDRLPGARRAG